MDKKVFRQQQIQRLSQMTPEQRVAQNLSLQKQLFAEPAWQAAQTVAITISSGIEVDTRPIVKQAWADGKRVVIPKTLPHRQMAFYPYTDASQLQKTKFGILEPTEGQPVTKDQIDLILVPGLGYGQTDHTRIGFGGGYYDRYLADYQGAKCTLAFQVMAFDHAEWPVETFDVRLGTLLVAKDGGHE